MATTTNLLALGLATIHHVYGTPYGRGNSAQAAAPSNWRGAGQTAGSPAYNYMFQFPCPIPEVAEPEYTQTIGGRTIQFYSSTVEPFTKQIYPNLGPAHLVGYNGTVPGPTYIIEKDTETIIRYLNKGETTSSVHLHGSYTHSVWDGWADDELDVGQWKDYYYPNSESGRAMWYHDHADGHTASDAYYGQAGVYIIHDPAEDSLGLPSGKYDIPLALTDKTYQSNGDVAAPGNDPINFFGDTIEVNNQPWPYLAVEPRKYRLRFFDMALSRPFDLYFEDPSGNWIEFEVIASDSGLFGGPVKSNDLTIAMGERYEVVVDFSGYAGKNISLNNNMQQQQVQEYDKTDQVMRFVVGNSVSDSSNNGAVPSTLNGNIQWPAQRTTVDHTFNFQMGGESTWTINGIDFSDVNNRVLARPPQGTVELWELRHTGGPAVHPVHIHLVNLQVVSRTGGSRGVLPYEAAGLKDTVLLEPGETVQVRAFYGPWNGVYMFHCHNLVHEDHHMLDAFNVTILNALGYDFNSSLVYSDPMDTRFHPQEYSESLYEPAAISSAIASLGSMNPYGAATALSSAENAYYTTAGYHGDASSVAPATTVVPSSSGYGFASTTATASTVAVAGSL
ncbi:Multicopper oxidase [Teratosphaeria destructans]|uniref:Multicopper oxidase n=1 Tax=Teratosphaeria destructans TaxID=418781 RepID=A0A9W7W0D1_9PEZI|nr:Multicopper oxidase [Teratosphaeria destructans]